MPNLFSPEALLFKHPGIVFLFRNAVHHYTPLKPARQIPRGEVHLANACRVVTRGRKTAGERRQIFSEPLIPGRAVHSMNVDMLATHQTGAAGYTGGRAAKVMGEVHTILSK